MNIVELRKITYTPHGQKSPILKDVELTITQGDFVLLEGENFGGKSTLVDIILGFREPDNKDAQIKVFGGSPDSLKAKFNTGVVFQEKIELPSWTKVGKFMDLIESHCPDAKGKVTSFLQKSDIKVDEEFLSKETNNENRSPFAGSEARIFTLALALARSPKLLILDEPTAALTPENKRKYWQYVKTFSKEGGTVLVVSPKDKENDSVIEKELQENDIKPTKKLFLDKEKKNLILTLSNKPHSENIKTDFAAFEKIGIFHWIVLALKYAGMNFEKLRNQPTTVLLNFAVGIFFVIMVAFFSNLLPEQFSLVIPYSNYWLIVNICCFYLAVISITAIANDIVLKRKESVWLKFRQTLPVPALVYLFGEVIPYLLIWSLLAFLITITSSICFHLPFLSIFNISLCFVVGLLPLLFLGLIIGYRLPLDSVNLIALFLPFLFELPLIFGFYLRLILLSQSGDKIPQYIAKFAYGFDLFSTYSPIYHWVQLALGSVDAREYDQYFWLHLFWLIGIISIFGLLAVKTYRGYYKLAIANVTKKQET